MKNKYYNIINIKYNLYTYIILLMGDKSNIKIQKNPREKIYSSKNISNLPLLQKIKNTHIYTIGNVYLYKDDIDYNENLYSNLKIDENTKITWEYYILNNFIYSKSVYEKLNKRNYELVNGENIETYPLKIFPFEESIEELKNMEYESSIISLIEEKKNLNKLNKLSLSNNNLIVINNLKNDIKYRFFIILIDKKSNELKSLYILYNKTIKKTNKCETK